MRVPEAAKRLEVSVSLVYALVAAGKVRCQRHGLGAAPGGAVAFCVLRPSAGRLGDEGLAMTEGELDQAQRLELTRKLFLFRMELAYEGWADAEFRARLEAADRWTPEEELWRDYVRAMEAHWPTYRDYGLREYSDGELRTFVAAYGEVANERMRYEEAQERRSPAPADDRNVLEDYLTACGVSQAYPPMRTAWWGPPPARPTYRGVKRWRIRATHEPWRGSLPISGHASRTCGARRPVLPAAGGKDAVGGGPGDGEAGADRRGVDERLARRGVIRPGRHRAAGDRRPGRRGAGGGRTECRLCRLAGGPAGDAARSAGQARRGRLGGPQPDQKDLVRMGLARVVGVGAFDQRLKEWKESEDRPWAEMPEDVKVRVLVDLAQDAGPPGAYTLEAIYREVDRSKVSPWRREALDGLRDRLDHGELDGENPNPLYQGDRAELALRMAELEARIEDDKRIGLVESRDRRTPWRELGEEQKYDLILGNIDELHLGSEASAYLVLAREVDLTRLPEPTRREFEESRAEAWPRPEPALDAFDRVAANLPEQWAADGFAAAEGPWKALSEEIKIGYLADFAGAYRVPFERFEATARQTLGITPKQEFTPDEEWCLRSQYREGLLQLGRIRADERDRTRPARYLRDAQPMRESDDQRDERLSSSFASGVFFVEGWDAPHLTSPPASSAPGAVDRGERRSRR